MAPGERREPLPRRLPAAEVGMPTVTVDLREGFEGDTVEMWLGGESRWRGDSVTTNVVVSLAASVPLEIGVGESELRVTVPSRGLEATLPLHAEQDVHVAADVAGGALRLEQLAERPYYL